MLLNSTSMCESKTFSAPQKEITADLNQILGLAALTVVPC